MPKSPQKNTSMRRLGTSNTLMDIIFSRQFLGTIRPGTNLTDGCPRLVMGLELVSEIELTVPPNRASDRYIRAFSGVIHLLDLVRLQVGILFIDRLWRRDNVLRSGRIPCNRTPVRCGVDFPRERASRNVDKGFHQ